MSTTATATNDAAAAADLPPKGADGAAPSTRSAILSVTALLIGTAILLLGNSLQGTLLPIRARLEQFDAFEIGVLGSAYFFGFALGGVYGPALVGGVGHIRAFTAMVAIASAVVLVHAMAIDPMLWWILRAATGLCFAVIYIVIESWLNAKATNTNRGLIFGIYTVVSFLMISLGQLLLPLAPVGEYVLFVLASILVSIAAVPVALTRAEQPAPPPGTNVRIWRIYRISPVGFVGCLLVGAANGSFWSLAPLYAQEAGERLAIVGAVASAGPESDPALRTAIFMAAATLFGALGQWPLGWLSDRLDRRAIIVLASLGSAAAGVALVGAELGGGAEQTRLALAAAYGFFSFPIYALCVANVNDFVEPDGFVEAASGVLLIWAVGAILGPLGASYAVAAAGAGGLFAATAAIHGALALFALYRMRARAARPRAERGVFRDAVRVVATVSNIDPVTAPKPTEPAATARSEERSE